MPKSDANDDVRVDGPSQQTITSLAYWLTPEGINPVTAELVQQAIDEDDDAQFAEAFDGASKEDAREFLEKWELCYMPYWSGEEVVRVIAMSGNTRNAAVALRAITLAQQAGELEQVFTPRQGVLWAMARGYMLYGDICRLVGVQPSHYGHPHNSLQEYQPPASGETGQSNSPLPGAETGKPIEHVKSWKLKAEDAALTYIARHKKQNLYPSQGDVAAAVAANLQQDGVMGDHGKPISAAYIEREVLRGEWWAKNRP